MKDGFDRSVAEKMPKIQKKRPNRPWNVDPVLLKAQEEEKPNPGDLKHRERGGSSCCRRGPGNRCGIQRERKTENRG